MQSIMLIVDAVPGAPADLRAILKTLLPENPLLVVTTANAALSILHAQPAIAMILLDCQFRDYNSLELLQIIHAQHPQLPVALFSNEIDAALVDTGLAMGAQGVIHKNAPAEVVQSALQLIMAGEIYIPRLRLQDILAARPRMLAVSFATPLSMRLPEQSQLTPRQREVLRLMVEGYSNKEICARLHLSMGTIKSHCNAIFRDLNVNNRTQAAQAARHVLLV
jgi:DNA-binding NarL/FixJ family response regulator